MDLEFSPSILDTPSLLTPNLPADPIIFKSSYVTTEKTSVETPAIVKLSKIEHELKQTFAQARQPTQSPFEKIAVAGVLTVDKPPPTDDGLPGEIPSTAEVMNVIESLAKNLAKDSSEREIQLDSPSIMGVIVSPKKKLLYRSQSQTDELLLDDQQQFQRLNDIPLLDSEPIPPVTKGQKRATFPSHEVTSSNPVLAVPKRQKLIPTPVLAIPVRASTNEDAFTGSDDPRKQQIRDSNREAARRCRERRRNYIEQLEGNLEQYKAQIKQLSERIGRAERENTQLRAIISETKLFQSNVEFPSAMGTD